MTQDKEYRVRVAMDGNDRPDAAVNATAFTEDGEEIVAAVREAVKEVVDE